MSIKKEPLIPPMPGVSPEDALRTFMKADPDMVKEPTIQERLDDVMLQAARNVLGSHIGWPATQVADQPADAIRAAIQKLPATGKIRGKKKEIVKAMILVLDEVPMDSKGREGIATSVEDLDKRT